MGTITIKKGTHRCLTQITLPVKAGNKSCKVAFTDSCIYQLDAADQSDWNKLEGYTIGLFTPVHKDSIRFGWRYLNNALEIAPYWYVDGQRHTAETDNLQVVKLVLNNYYDFKIAKNGSTYTLSVVGNDGVNKSWQLINMKTAGMGWSLGLYFGGNCKAPHNISVVIK